MGKSCNDATGGAVKCRVSENVTAQCLDISTSAEFTKVAKSVCPNINVLYFDKEQVETRNPNWIIYGVPVGWILKHFMTCAWLIVLKLFSYM